MTLLADACATFIYAAILGCSPNADKSAVDLITQYPKTAAEFCTTNKVPDGHCTEYIEKYLPIFRSYAANRAGFVDRK